MNLNSKIIATSLIVLMLLSLAGSANAGQVGLWMSSKNDPGDHQSENHIGFQNYQIGFENGMTYTIRNSGTNWHTRTAGHGVYFDYPDGKINGTKLGTPKWINITFHVWREDGKYKHDNFFQMTFPVEGNWVCGVTPKNSKVGMFFTATDVKSGSGDFADRIRCYMDGKEAWMVNGGKWHWSELDQITYPNGQVWT
ncbi:MAG: hypothetical protein LBR15_03940 [Methanobrevibacter sp.]|nr:hypothetical protein [Candidatus Methanovirga australis]